MTDIESPEAERVDNGLQHPRDDDRHRVRIEAIGDSVDRALEVLPRLYAGADWWTAPTGTSFGFRYAGMGDAETMTFRTSRLRGYIEGTIPPGGDLVIQWIVAGHGTVDVGRDELQLQVGRPVLFPTHRPFVFGYTDYDQRIVHLNRHYVEGIAAESWMFVPGSLTFDHMARPSDASVRQWWAAIDQAMRALRQGPVGPLLWDELSRAVVEAFLAMYPPAATELPPALLVPRHEHIRAAVDLIHAEAHRPIGVVELAAAANLSARALQEAFQRIFGESPLSFLRRVRLDRVRAELLVLDPTTTSVADVAARWGFAHMGRFSGAYRQRFGEYPKDTLRR